MNNLLTFSKKIDVIEKIIGYNFDNKELLIEAFTHPSYNQKKNYEKMEFLGDSLINSFTTLWLYHNKTQYNVGELSIEKSQIINNKLLSSIVKHLKLNKYILVGKKVQINEKIRSDLFESLAAAIYLDADIDRLYIFLYKTLINNLQYFNKEIDFKGKFINYIQDTTSNEYKFNTTFDKKKSMFISSIKLDNNVIFGYGKNKKIAEQCASKKALEIINKKLF